MPQQEYIIIDEQGATDPCYVKVVYPFEECNTKEAITTAVWQQQHDRDVVMAALNNGSSRFTPGTRTPH